LKKKLKKPKSKSNAPILKSDDVPLLELMPELTKQDIKPTAPLAEKISAKRWDNTTCFLAIRQLLIGFKFSVEKPKSVPKESGLHANEGLRVRGHEDDSGVDASNVFKDSTVKNEH